MQVPPTLYYETIGSGHALPVYGDVLHAIDGFEALDYQLQPFCALDYRLRGADFLRAYRPGDVVVGSVETLRAHFRSVQCLPPDLDYPEALRDPALSGRTVQRTTLGLAEAWFGAQGAFMKPVRGKLPGFQARPYLREEVATLLRTFAPATEVFVSPWQDYVTELRAFVHQNRIVDLRRYRKTATKWTLDHPDYARLQQMVAAYAPDAPVAYTLDVALTEQGETVLVEVNDFWAVGAYGLDPPLYAQLLRDRYTQLLVRRC